MQAFEYVAAESVQQVVDLLAANDGGARILAGGTDLIVQLREGRRNASLLIDIKSLREATQLTFDPQGGLTIGAAAPCCRVAGDAAVQAAFPGVADAVGLVGGTQIQGRASLGGNLCNASPAADTIPALIVHHAQCEVAGPQGTRLLPVEDFCVAPGRNALLAGEFLVAIHLPPPPQRFGAHYLRFTPRNEMDIAVAGAGASVVLAADAVTISAARLALGAVAPVPLLVAEAGDWLVGRAASRENVEHAARIAQQAARPIDDMRGTAAQRKHLSYVLARRALEKALERAGYLQEGKA